MPEISTTLFASLDYINSLKDVFALTHPSVVNRVFIEEGTYWVSALTGGDQCITISSNTDLVLNGTICLIPNNFVGCDILNVSGSNISISGKGKIIGDKNSHTGKDGEWGMGVHINQSQNIHIAGISIRECWGDCIYVGGFSSYITIANCSLDQSRRQGISITGAENVIISNCYISNIAGTDPEYAIDIEPNKNCICNNITIDSVTTANCKGGFGGYGKAEGAYIGRVIIRNSSITGDGKDAISFTKCQCLIIDNCEIKQKNKVRAIVCTDVDDVSINNNTIVLYPHSKIGLKALFKRLTREQKTDKIILDRCNKTSVEKNVIK